MVEPQRPPKCYYTLQSRLETFFGGTGSSPVPQQNTFAVDQRRHPNVDFQAGVAVGGSPKSTPHAAENVSRRDWKGWQHFGGRRGSTTQSGQNFSLASGCWHDLPPASPSNRAWIVFFGGVGGVGVTPGESGEFFSATSGVYMARGQKPATRPQNAPIYKLFVRASNPCIFVNELQIWG